MLTMEYIKENEKTYQVQIEELTNRVEYEQRRNQRKDKEIERLNNIIKRFEEDLREVYLTFGEFSEEYIENRIKELKGESNEKN